MLVSYYIEKEMCEPEKMKIIKIKRHIGNAAAN